MATVLVLGLSYFFPAVSPYLNYLLDYPNAQLLPAGFVMLAVGLILGNWYSSDLTTFIHEEAHAIVAELLGDKDVAFVAAGIHGGITRHTPTTNNPLRKALVSIAGPLGELILVMAGVIFLQEQVNLVAPGGVIESLRYLMPVLISVFMVFTIFTVLKEGVFDNLIKPLFNNQENVDNQPPQEIQADGAEVKALWSKMPDKERKIFIAIVAGYLITLAAVPAVLLSVPYPSSFDDFNLHLFLAVIRDFIVPMFIVLALFVLSINPTLDFIENWKNYTATPGNHPKSMDKGNASSSPADPILLNRKQFEELYRERPTVPPAAASSAAEAGRGEVTPGMDAVALVVLAAVVKQKLAGVSFRLLTDKGGYVDVFQADTLPGVIVKAAKPGVDFAQKVLPGYRIAKDRLGHLFVVMVLENLDITVNGVNRHYDYLLVQERAREVEEIVRPLEEEAGYWRGQGQVPEAERAEAQIRKIQEDFLELSREFWKRGVADKDFSGWRANYGYTQDGRMVGFDVDEIILAEDLGLAYDIFGFKDTDDEWLNEAFSGLEVAKWKEIGLQEQIHPQRVPDVFQVEIRKAQEARLAALLTEQSAPIPPAAKPEGSSPVSNSGSESWLIRARMPNAASRFIRATFRLVVELSIVVSLLELPALTYQGYDDYQFATIDLPSMQATTYDDAEWKVVELIQEKNSDIYRYYREHRIPVYWADIEDENIGGFYRWSWFSGLRGVFLSRHLQDAEHPRQEIVKTLVHEITHHRQTRWYILPLEASVAYGAFLYRNEQQAYEAGGEHLTPEEVKVDYQEQYQRVRGVNFWLFVLGRAPAMLASMVFIFRRMLQRMESLGKKLERVPESIDEFPLAGHASSSPSATPPPASSSPSTRRPTSGCVSRCRRAPVRSMSRWPPPW